MAVLTAVVCLFFNFFMKFPLSLVSHSVIRDNNLTNKLKKNQSKRYINKRRDAGGNDIWRRVCLLSEKSECSVSLSPLLELVRRPVSGFNSNFLDLEGVIPDESKALSLMAPANAVAGLLPGGGLLPTPNPLASVMCATPTCCFVLMRL